MLMGAASAREVPVSTGGFLEQTVCGRVRTSMILPIHPFAKALIRNTAPLLGLSVLFLVACAAPGAGNEPPNESLQRESEELRLSAGQRALRRSLRDKLEEARRNLDIPGLGAAVVAHGEVVLAEGFGHVDRARTARVDEHTPFRLASITKSFVGAALMRAVELDLIKLDEPVALDNPHIDGETIVVRQLANHTSGLRDSDFYLCGYVRADLSGYLSPEQQTFCPQPPITTLDGFLSAYLTPGAALYGPGNFASGLDARPGTVGSYSNAAVALLGQTLDRRTGSLRGFMQRELFGPLKLRDTVWSPSELRHPRRAVKGYDVLEEGGPVKEVPEYTFPTWPDGGLWSSAHDLATFLRMVMANGGLDGRRVLTASSVQEMLRPTAAVESDMPDYGVLWAHFEGLIGHTGSDPGTLTMMGFVPDEQVGVVLLLNVGDTAVGADFFPMVREFVADARALAATP
ncbi:MAG: hypothetical protein JWN48_5031 [Myxococcaceae bacterium]|nr:hypothetical protein [Myxococcaceae bacterium]